jgi:hypothetical protein
MLFYLGTNSTDRVGRTGLYQNYIKTKFQRFHNDKHLATYLHETLSKE